MVFVKCQRFVRFPIFREVKICQEKDKYKGMCSGVLGRILQFVFRDFGWVMHLILSKAFLAVQDSSIGDLVTHSLSHF